jgi:hypothetical protein
MILDAESWMNIRRFRALHAAGATYAEIAAEVGRDWRTVKKVSRSGRAVGAAEGDASQGYPAAADRPAGGRGGGLAAR